MNIFVTKLSPITTSEDLHELFKEFGRVVSAKVLIDSATGRSKCFGFVEMEDFSQSQNAIEALNGTELNGNLIIVKAARPRELAVNTKSNKENKRETKKDFKNSRHSKDFRKEGKRANYKLNPKGKEKSSPKMRKPYIREYTMMELMEDCD